MLKTSLVVGLAILSVALGGAAIWEEKARRFEVYDISSTSNCCACKLTVVTIDRWTGKLTTKAVKP